MAVGGRTVALVAVLLLGAGAAGVGAGVLFGGEDRTAGRATDVAAAGGAPSSTPPLRTAAKIPAPLPGGKPVPVYVLGETGLGPRLYREFRAGTPAADPVTAGLAELAAAPGDPDYRSPWLGVPARATRAGAAVTVTFSATPDLGPREAALAVQQVVWTVTAADPSVQQVRVVAPGLPAGAAAGRADQSGVLAPVWLLDPVDGAAAGGPMTVSGTASVFEATVSVEVRRGTDVVARTTVTATVGAPGRGDWKATMSVPPGDYVVAAYEESAKDGSRLGVDTKRVTVSGR